MTESVAPAVSPDSAGRRYHRSLNQLLHLTSLARTGQGTSALERLLLVALHLGSGSDDSRGMDVGAIVDALDVFFGVRRQAEVVREHLDHHIRSFQVRKHAGGGYALTPAAAAVIESRIQAAHDLEVQIRDEWLAELEEHGLDDGLEHQALWLTLKDYISRVFQRHGALSVELLDPASRSDEDEVDLEILLDAAISEHGISAQKAVAAEAVAQFFRRRTASRSKYLAELLDGTFTFFALQSHDALDAYVADLKPLSLFLDTNVILSLLGADDEAHELARELVEFIRANELPCTLYYHEATLREVERTLEGVGRHLCSKHWPPSTSAAAVKSRTGSGIERKYHSLNAERPISARGFVERFSNVRQLLDDLGVVIYRPSASAEKDLGEVSSLIADYGSFVRSARRDEKPYEALDHDVRVWLSVRERRRRAGGGSTALDAGALLVSNDHLLRHFCRRKLASGRVPTVVLPEQLLQVLRPFGSSDADWDARFIETFAVPEFRTAASDYGDAAGKLLEYLTLYGDLPEETAVKLLTDQLLLDELSGIQTDEEFAAVVENSLAEENRALAEEQDRLRRRVEELEDGEAARTGEHDEREAELQRVKEERSVAERGRDELARRVARLETVGRWSLAAVVLAVVAIGLLLVPRAVRWSWLLGHENWFRLQLLGLIAAVAAGGTVINRKWLGLLATVVVAVVSLL
jgi:predicted nucleic acid-binding protein